ncbi:hypothetical protein BAQU_0247 [Bifidobacterium aquikefiri]|uniref:Uncharacterized protein n=1 Tax=Bifidobacterium aquikefiri TaxID=1653207 RepID=A0A261GAJ0_9BIFI|nr:hypothetical protein BAQU_0247 [Bifidobacterium aquikefiri]
MNFAAYFRESPSISVFSHRRFNVFQASFLDKATKNNLIVNLTRKEQTCCSN